MSPRCLIASLVALIALPLGAQEKMPPDLARLLEVVQRELAARPAADDLPDLARRLGNREEALVAFMRNEVAWLPYRGGLRGAAGTLAARGGNSLDRALLLQALLRVGGERCRLARVRLSDETAGRLVERFLTAKEEPAPAGPGKERLASLANRVGADPGRLAAWLARERRREIRLLDRVLEAAEGETNRLRTCLGAAGLEPEGSWREGLLKEARDHYLVQVKGPEKWRSLAPLLDDKELARLSPSPVNKPDRLLPRIRFTVNLTRKAAGKEEKERLLQVSRPLSAVAMKGVFLALTPDQSNLPAAAKMWAMPLAERRALLTRVKLVRLELHLDGSVWGGVPFDLAGRTYKVDGDGRVSAAKGLGRALGGLMGGMSGGGEEKSDSTLVGVDLEIAITGAGERVYRRRLLDGPVRQGAGRILPVVRWAFLVQNRSLAAGEGERVFLAALARNLDTIDKILTGRADRVQLAPPRRIAGNLADLARLRERLARRLLAGGEAVRLWDRVNILAESWSLVAGADRNTLHLAHGLDLVENGTPLVPRRGDPAAAAWRTLALGVADTALEALLLTPSVPGQVCNSAWAIMERERLTGGELKVTDQGRTGLRVAWGTGGAWWSLERSTGVTVGRVPSGGGQAMLEAAIQVKDRINTICDVSNLAKMFIAAKPPQSNLGKAGMKMWDAVCGIAAGNLPASVLQWQMDDMCNGLWEGATKALAGL